jgi:hypothetical protein
VMAWVSRSSAGRVGWFAAVLERFDARFMGVA